MMGVLIIFLVIALWIFRGQALSIIAFLLILSGILYLLFTYFIEIPPYWDMSWVDNYIFW